MILNYFENINKANYCYDCHEEARNIFSKCTNFQTDGAVYFLWICLLDSPLSLISQIKIIRKSPWPYLTMSSSYYLLLDFCSPHYIFACLKYCNNLWNDLPPSLLLLFSRQSILHTTARKIILKSSVIMPLLYLINFIDPSDPPKHVPLLSQQIQLSYLTPLFILL